MRRRFVAAGFAFIALLANRPVIAKSLATSVVPLHDIGGILVVDTMINSQGPYHFVLDTGAGITVVTPELAKTLHLEAGDGDTAHGTGDRAVAVRLTTLKRVDVGQASQEQVSAAIIPLPPDLTYQGAFGTIDGIVGFSFLRKYAVALEIGRGRAEFTPSAQFTPPSNVGSIPVTFTSDGIPTVSARIDGALGRFEIDSGNNDATSITQRFAVANGVGKGYTTGLHSQSVGVGGSTGVTTIRVERTLIGTFTIHGTPTEVSKTTTSAVDRARLDGNIGYDVLHHFDVTLDYAGARLYVKPGSQFDSRDEVIGTGIIPQRNGDGTYQVVDVSRGTPASEAGIRAGETILAINGTDVRSMSAATYRSAVGKTTAKAITYTLRKAGATRRVTVRTADLLPE